MTLAFQKYKSFKLPLLPIRVEVYGSFSLYPMKPGNYPAGYPIPFIKSKRLTGSFTLEFASTRTRYANGYVCGDITIDPIPWNRVWTLFSFGTRDEPKFPWFVVLGKQFS